MLPQAFWLVLSPWSAPFAAPPVADGAAGPARGPESTAASPGDRAPAWSAQVAVADFDGDGREDVALAGGSAPDRLLLGQPDGSLREATLGSGLEGERGSQGFLANDIDGDGRLDLVRVGADGGVDVLHAVGGASFELWPVVAAAPDAPRLERVRRATVRDLDGDGRGDLVAEREDGHTAVALGMPGGGFVAQRPATRQDPVRDGSAGGAKGGSAPLPVATGMIDAATGDCLAAGSTPRNGRLYPLTANLNVDASGRVGMGTTTPQAELHVAGGGLSMSGDLLATFNNSTVLKASAGTAPDVTGTLRLLTPNPSGGSPISTVILEADSPLTNVKGLLNLYSPVDGSVLELAGEMSSVAPFGQIQMGDAGGVRATMSGRNPDSPLDTPQIALANEAVKPTVQLSGSWAGAGRIALGNEAGSERAILESGVQPSMALLNSEGDFTVALFSGSENGASSLRMDTNQAIETVRVEDNWNSSGCGHAQISAQGMTPTVVLDAGSAGGKALVQLLQQDGSPGVEMLADKAADTGKLTLFAPEGDEQVTFARDFSFFDSGYMELARSEAEAANVRIGLGEFAGVNSKGLFVASNAGPSELALGTKLGASGEYGFWSMHNGAGTFEGSVSNGNLYLQKASGDDSLSWEAQTGDKHAIVETESHGDRQLYVREGTQAWLEDAGLGSTVAGRARVEIDPLFLEAVSTSEDDPLRVFVTPYGDAALTVEVDASGFTVCVAGQDPRARDVPFAWIVQATRAGFEGVRLEPQNARPGRASPNASTLPQPKVDSTEKSR